MKWSEYVAFTATTALPVASDPTYLAAGVVEECHEFLAAYHAYKAAVAGLRKRRLRGDPAEVIYAKRRDASAAYEKMVEELGDLAWYVARICGEQIGYDDIYPDVETALASFRWDPPSDSKNAAAWLLERMRQLDNMPLSLALERNVEKLTARKAAGTIQGEGDR
jgi:NTP pyrophosphatase (non-canonical NTP hydrolase)